MLDLRFTEFDPERSLARLKFRSSAIWSYRSVLFIRPQGPGMEQ